MRKKDLKMCYLYEKVSLDYCIFRRPHSLSYGEDCHSLPPNSVISLKPFCKNQGSPLGTYTLLIEYCISEIC